MTDPSAMEAPSKVGSFLIWQQPHIIYLAELVYRANPSAELIKKYNPRYNVLLKDDKTYPSIAVTKEEFPRIFSTRLMSAVSPTTVRRSPSCSTRSGVASSCTSERYTRLMFMP